MGAVLAVIVVLAVSLVVARIGSAALALTGLSREVARFQARERVKAAERAVRS